MKQERKFYIVWNDGRTEGFITDDEDDARQCLVGNYRSGSTVGIAFAEAYEDDERSLEAVNLATIPDPEAYIAAARGMREALEGLKCAADACADFRNTSMMDDAIAEAETALLAFDAAQGEQ